jgi:hypothetical protein
MSWNSNARRSHVTSWKMISATANGFVETAEHMAHVTLAGLAPERRMLCRFEGMQAPLPQSLTVCIVCIETPFDVADSFLETC